MECWRSGSTSEYAWNRLLCSCSLTWARSIIRTSMEFKTANRQSLHIQLWLLFCYLCFLRYGSGVNLVNPKSLKIWNISSFWSKAWSQLGSAEATGLCSWSDAWSSSESYFFMEDFQMIIKVALFVSVQAVYFAYILILRPQDSVKENLSDFINEVFYLYFVVFLLHFNTEGRWNNTITDVYFWILMLNNFILILIMLGNLK